MNPKKGKKSWTTAQKLESPKGLLELELEIDTEATSQCLTELYVYIRWTAEGTEQNEIGQLEAYIINRTVRSEAGEKLWLEDFSSLEDDHLLVGVRDLNATFFNSAGSRKPRYKALASELKADRFVFINKLNIEPEYQGANFGTHSLQVFHQQLRDLPARFELAESTVLLQPSYLGNGEVSEQTKAAIQQKLVRFYTRNLYHIYHQDSDTLSDTEGTFVLMGRKLALDTNEKQLEDDSDDHEDSDDSEESEEDDTESTKDTNQHTVISNHDDGGDAMSLDAGQHSDDDEEDGHDDAMPDN